MSIANYQDKCGKVTNEKAYQYFLEQRVHDIWIGREKRGVTMHRSKGFYNQTNIHVDNRKVVTVLRYIIIQLGCDKGLSHK